MDQAVKGEMDYKSVHLVDGLKFNWVNPLKIYFANTTLVVTTIC